MEGDLVHLTDTPHRIPNIPTEFRLINNPRSLKAGEVEVRLTIKRDRKSGLLGKYLSSPPVFPRSNRCSLVFPHSHRGSPNSCEQAVPMVGKFLYT